MWNILINALDKGGINVFHPSFVITIDQMRAGFQRIYDMMGDISIDVPQVDHKFHEMLTGCLISSNVEWEKMILQVALSKLLFHRPTWCLSGG